MKERHLEPDFATEKPAWGDAKAVEAGRSWRRAAAAASSATHDAPIPITVQSETLTASHSIPSHREP